MARQEAQSRLLYYPTSEQVVDLAATWFSNPQRSRLADPCVGEGEALARFKARIGGEAETWGVEVSYTRAERARRIIDVVLPASFYHVKWADRTVSFLWNNPPYDFSDYRDERGKFIRHERLFVVQATRRLVPGGHHVIIVPRSMLPILSNVLLATDQGRLKLSATNLEVGLTCWIGAKVEEEGATTVSARTFVDLVSAMPQERVDLALAERTHTLNMRCGHFENNVRGIDPAEFPVVPGLDGKTVIRAEAGLLRTAINQVVFGGWRIPRAKRALA